MLLQFRKLTIRRIFENKTVLSIYKKETLNF